MNQSLFHETNLTDEEKVKKAFDLLESVNDMVIKLWRIGWGIAYRQNISPDQYMWTQRLIKEYGYTPVRQAFEASAKAEVRNLNYVAGICKRNRENEYAKKEIEGAQALKDAPISEEARQTTASVIKELRMSLGVKENKYLRKQPMTKTEYIAEFGAHNFSEATYREYKNNFKG